MLEIIVKATTANLGPGFDCLGLALDMENRIIIKEAEGDFKDKKNLIYLSIKKIYDLAGKIMPDIQIEQQIGIPICRGLGSSAACIAAGCTAGNKMSNAGFSINELIKIATEIEGHPDNVVPAFLGGFTVSSMENDDVIYFHGKAYEGFKFAVMYPEFTLSTSEARGVLPQNIPFKDGVYNTSKASLLTAAMITGNGELLKYACKDKMHQPYRQKLIPGFNEITDKAHNLGALAHFLSGAGPTIIAILPVDDNSFENPMREFINTLNGGWTIEIVKASDMGVQMG